MGCVCEPDGRTVQAGMADMGVLRPGSFANHQPLNLSLAKRALYILQVKRSKLNEESLKLLKCVFLHILRTTELKHIVLEVYFDETEFFPLQDNLE